MRQLHSCLVYETRKVLPAKDTQNLMLHKEIKMCMCVRQLSNNIYPHQEHRKRGASSVT